MRTGKLGSESTVLHTSELTGLCCRRPVNSADSSSCASLVNNQSGFSRDYFGTIVSWVIEVLLANSTARY
jgi:hypothetical protein